MKILKLNKNKIFLNLVFFIAPMGKILIPFDAFASFRAFYLFLPLSVTYLYITSKIDDKVKVLLFLYLLLCFASVVININLLPQDFELHKNPFSRVIIHNSISSFFILSAWIALNSSITCRWTIIKNVTTGFIITLIIGFAVYIMVIIGILPLQFYERMNVITQHGYGFLRFSPGSYPNEFGVMSAYFCILSIYLIIHNNIFFKKKYLYFLFVLSFIGMALATTRAAYISFAVSFIYLFISFTLKNRIKFIGFLILIIIALIIFVPDTIFQYAYTVLDKGYNSAVNSAGSVSERYIAWEYGLNLFSKNMFFGVGFENPEISMLHNTYLQFLFGFGIIGTALFLLPIFFIICYIFKIQYQNNYNRYDKQYRDLAIIGLINVLSFALTNHNQNHFLTWFTIFLFLSSGCLSKRLNKR
jgi:O-antigen ligase